MRSRLRLHEELVNILGSRYVYFQPPESIKLNYPCIIYERYDISNTFADDDVYLDPRQYRITVVDKNPDSEIGKILKNVCSNFKDNTVWRLT